MFNNEQDLSFKQFFSPLTTKKAVCIVFIIGFFVYGNALFGEFVWDDAFQIVNNTNIFSLQKIPSLFSLGQLGYYRPVFFSFLAILYSLFNTSVFFYHTFQVLIHIINTLLIYGLFNRFFKKQISLSLSLLFLVHPINVEAVSYISAISDPLAIFFGLLSLHIMTRERINAFSIFTAILFMLSSLLTKEVGFPILLIIIFYNILFKKNYILPTALFTCITLVLYFFLRMYVAHVPFHSMQFAPITQVPFLERLINIPKIIHYYIFTFFIPLKLSIAQYWTVKKINVQEFIFPLIFDIVFSLCLIYPTIILYTTYAF